MLDPTQHHVPVVVVREGKLFADSRDVAAFFGRGHSNVLRSIDNLIAEEPSLGHGLEIIFDFKSFEVKAGNGAMRPARYCLMNRKGFTLLAMGFTGSKALKFKLAYIDAFDRMETELQRRSQTPTPDLSDAATLHALLLTHTQKAMVLENKVAELEPKAKAHDRIAKSDGSFCITDAAKMLQIRPTDLFKHLSQNKWIFKRLGQNWIAYQRRVDDGVLEHKTSTVLRDDGTEKTVSQVRVTTKGLTTLAREVPGAQLPDLFI